MRALQNGSGVSFVREVVLASAGMAVGLTMLLFLACATIAHHTYILQVRIEQDPKMLPPDVQEREYKEFTAGAKANTVRELLRMEALGRPLSVRIVTWNDVFQSLKGFEKTVYVMLGGVVAEVRLIFVCIVLGCCLLICVYRVLGGSLVHLRSVGCNSVTQAIDEYCQRHSYLSLVSLSCITSVYDCSL